MTTSYTMKDMPDHGFWKRVKVLAATKGVTIKQLILNLLSEAIKDNDNPKK